METLWAKHRLEIESALLDQGAELTLLVDRSTRTILAARGASEAVLGESLEALQGRPLSLLEARGTSGFPFRVELVDEPGHFRELEVTTLRGESRAVALRILHLEAEPGLTLLSLTDVSVQAHLSGELRRVHAQLQLAYQQLRTQQRALDEARRAASLSLFAAGLAHELNNPVGIALSTAGTLAEMAGELQEPTRSADLKTASDDLSEIGAMSLELKGGLTRVATIVKLLGELENRAQCTAFDLVPIARECARRYNAELAAPARLMAESDSDSVNRFLVKVLENARRAAGPAGRVAVSVAEERNDVLVSVSDSGGGVPQPMRERIFDPFFTTQPPGSGLGLGLFLARREVAYLGGSIHCEEAVEGGARIVARFPRTAPAEVAGASPGPSYESLRSAG